MVSRAKEYLAKRGKTVTLTTYAKTGNKDKQGDPKWNDSDSSISALKEVSGQAGASVSRSGFGQQKVWDAIFTVADEDVTVADLVDDEKRPAEVLDSDGVSFQVQAVGPEELGYRRLLCTTQRG